MRGTRLIADSSGNTSPADGNAFSVMIADDNSSLRRTIGDILRAAGLSDQTHVEDGLSAWKRLQGEHTDLLILDWDMPNMDGLELLHKIRKADSRFGHMKVLMLTAHNTRGDVIEAMEAGADDYIVKPFTPDTLYNKIEKLFECKLV